MTPVASRVHWHSIALTDTGHVRKLNEDAFMSRNDIGHWLVADGMGGHEAGDVASQLVAKELATLAIGDDFSNFVDRLEDKLLGANLSLREMAGGKEKIIGTTVAGLVLHQNHFLIYWVGDSRIYLYRDGELKQQSIDHTYTQHLVETGKIRQEEVRDHPDNNIITRAVGAADQLYIDFNMRRSKPGDLFLICSDGLDKELLDSEIQYFLEAPALSIEQKAQNMLQKSLQRAGRDNTTIILVQLEDNPNS